MRALLGLFVALSVSGCASVLGDVGTVVQAIWQSRSEPVLPGFGSGLQPRFRYLFVHPVGGTPAVFILGTERVTPDGLWESWYSKDGAFVETFNGGLTNIRAYGAHWASGQWLIQGTTVTRSRDVLGAQLFSVLDVAAVSSVNAANLPAAFQDTLRRYASRESSWQWTSHTYQTQLQAVSLPPAWFATGLHRGREGVVASFQCVTPSLCLRMLRWPVTEIDPQ